MEDSFKIRPSSKVDKYFQFKFNMEIPYQIKVIDLLQFQKRNMLQFRLLEKLHLSKMTAEETVNYLVKNSIPITHKKIGNSLHIKSMQNGFQLQYQNQKLNTVFLYFTKSNEKQDMQTYQYSCPFLLHEKSKLRGVSLQLGEPKTKSKYLTQCIYPNFGLGVVFKGSWDNQNSQIQYLYLFEAEEKDENMCNFCLKNKSKPKYGCNSCEWIGYCSDKCLKQHYPHHKIMCQQVD